MSFKCCFVGDWGMNVVYAILIGDDYLTDLTCLLHVAEGIDYIVSFEDMVGQRMEHILGKQGHHFGEQFAGKFGLGLHQLIGINAENSLYYFERGVVQSWCFHRNPVCQAPENDQKV